MIHDKLSADIYIYIFFVCLSYYIDQVTLLHKPNLPKQPRRPQITEKSRWNTQIDVSLYETSHKNKPAGFDQHHKIDIYYNSHFLKQRRSHLKLQGSVPFQVITSGCFSYCFTTSYLWRQPRLLFYYLGNSLAAAAPGAFGLRLLEPEFKFCPSLKGVSCFPFILVYHLQIRDLSTAQCS